MINKYSHLVFEVLAASYLYYYKNSSIMTDGEYDAKVKEILRLRPRKRLNNKLDKLINWKQLKTSTTLYYIKEKDYPQGLKRIALLWSSLNES